MKSFAKVNIFLKITGKRDNYHTLISRFMIVENLYDEVYFTQNNSNSFEIDGNFSCTLEKNSIYKAYKLLKDYTKDPNIDNFFASHKVVVEKNIPEFAGLGGGSSNAATFLNLVNNELNLNLSKDILASIGEKIGADVPFFIYNYSSANVSGIGEIVEVFDEEPLNIETFTPKIECDTPSVYKEFSKKFYKEYKDIEKIKKISSIEYLNTHTITEANDLYVPALSLYPSLQKYQKDNNFFSGSGSTFFKII
jgi:4-diphosphocytidyl-2-C-methyl-D-erythritol kinase